MAMPEATEMASVIQSNAYVKFSDLVRTRYAVITTGGVAKHAITDSAELFIWLTSRSGVGRVD